MVISGIHVVDVYAISFLDPFLRGLPDFILAFPLFVLGLASCCDLLDFGRYDINSETLATIIDQILWHNALLDYS